MNVVTLEYPDDLEQAVQLTPPELAARIQLMAALKMFELGHLSSSHAATLAGMSRPDFLEACGRYRVSIYNYSDEEVAAELRDDLAAVSAASAAAAVHTDA